MIWLLFHVVRNTLEGGQQHLNILCFHHSCCACLSFSLHAVAPGWIRNTSRPSDRLETNLVSQNDLSGKHPSQFSEPLPSSTLTCCAYCSGTQSLLQWRIIVWVHSLSVLLLLCMCQVANGTNNPKTDTLPWHYKHSNLLSSWLRDTPAFSWKKTPRPWWLFIWTSKICSHTYTSHLFICFLDKTYSHRKRSYSSTELLSFNPNKMEFHLNLNQNMAYDHRNNNSIIHAWNVQFLEIVEKPYIFPLI